MRSLDRELSVGSTPCEALPPFVVRGLQTAVGYSKLRSRSQVYADMSLVEVRTALVLPFLGKCESHEHPGLTVPLSAEQAPERRICCDTGLGAPHVPRDGFAIE